MTIELPKHRQERLMEILHSIAPSQKQVSLQKWHQVLGKLRSMAIALPDIRGLFSLLQEAFRHEMHGRLHLNKGVHSCLRDFRWICKLLTQRPTSLIYKVTPSRQPHLLGAQDASGYQMGGVWLPNTLALRSQATDNALRPTLWRADFYNHITKQLVT